LTTQADFQLCLHRLLMSTGRKSSHSSFLDVSRSNGVQWLSSTVHRQDLCEPSVTRLGRSTLLLSSKAPEQMTAECWRWRPRWNWLASSTSCFGSSACLQSLSRVLGKTAYGLVSRQGKLGGKTTTHSLTSRPSSMSVGDSR